MDPAEGVPQSPAAPDDPPLQTLQSAMEQDGQRSASEVEAQSPDTPPTLDEYTLAVQRLDGVGEIDVYVDTEVDRGGKKLKIGDIAPIINKQAEAIQALVDHNRTLTRSLKETQRLAATRMLADGERIQALEMKVAQGLDGNEDDADDNPGASRTPRKKVTPQKGKRKRVSKPKPPLQDKIRHFIHYCFHFKVGKEYAEIKGYPGWRVIMEDGIVTKWPHADRSGATSVSVSHGSNPVRPEENVTTTRYRPNWEDDQMQSSKDFIASVKVSVKEEFPDIDTTRTDSMIAGYWGSASRLYLQEWKIGEAYQASALQKRGDRRNGRRKTIKDHRSSDFASSPLALCQKEQRYRLALCRTSDLLVPEYVSGEDTDTEAKHRYEIFKRADTDDKMYERNYFARMSLGALGSAADVWEVRDIWWMSDELRQAGMVLDAYYYVKAGVHASKFWRGPKRYWASRNEQYHFPPVRPKQTDKQTPRQGVAGFVIYRFMVDVERVMRVTGGQVFVDSLYDDPPIPSEAPSFSAVDVLSQGGFPKVKALYAALWTQYQLTQKPVEKKDVRDQLEAWCEEDDNAFRPTVA